MEGDITSQEQQKSTSNHNGDTGTEEMAKKERKNMRKMLKATIVELDTALKVL